MTIKPIRSERDLRAAFKRLDVIFQAAAGTPQADEMEVLAALIEAYENKHYPIRLMRSNFAWSSKGCRRPICNLILGPADGSRKCLTVNVR